MDASKGGVEDLYRAAVGDDKAHYYLPLFERFDTPGGSRTSWNWPSLFVTFFWMIYRRMYGLALAYLLLWPVVLATAGGIMVAVAGQQAGALLYLLTVFVAQFVVIPLYANALYHGSVKRRINKLAADAPSHEAIVQRLIGQRGNVGVVVAVVAIGMVFVTGVLAAIAIPAYQDYVIRAQVRDGLQLAERAKESVAAGSDAGEISGQYVESIDVEDGVILIRYGNAAHSSITGRTLALRSVRRSDGAIEWSCGYAEAVGASSSNGVTDVPARLLPPQCRITLR